MVIGKPEYCSSKWGRDSGHYPPPGARARVKRGSVSMVTQGEREVGYQREGIKRRKYRKTRLGKLLSLRSQAQTDGGSGSFPLKATVLLSALLPSPPRP